LGATGVGEVPDLGILANGDGPPALYGECVVS